MHRPLNKARVALLLLPLLAVLLAYLPALQYGKVWDDWLLLGDYPAYLNPAAWRGALARPLPFSENYFRPLAMFSFVLEGFAGRGDQSAHLINLLLHGFNSCLLAFVALKLWPATPDNLRRRLWVALTIGLVFALHPAMSEAVAWIAGRFDLMVTSFVLLAILVDAAVLSPWRRALGVGLLFLAALLCKEMAVTLPLILVLLKAASAGQREWRQLFTRDRLMVYAALLAALLAYLAIRYTSLGYLMTREPEMAFLNLGSALQRILLIGAAFAGYLRIMLLPLSGISPMHYSPLPIPLADLSAWLGLLAIAVLGAGFLVLVRRAGARFVVLCLAASAVSLLPVLHIAPVAMLLGSTLTADRASMVPVALLLIGLGALACRVERRKVLAALGVCAAAWLLLSVLIIRVILPIWSNDTVLWSWTVSEMPECGVCHSNFARQLVFSGQEQLGLQEATLGLKLANQPWQFGMALGEQFQALRKLGRTDEALIAISKAVVAEPVPIIKLNYEMQQTDLLISTGRLKEAEALLNRVIARGDGNRVGVVTQLGMLALAGDRPDIARTLLDKASAARPSAMRNAIMAKTDDPARWTRMGDMYTAKNVTAEAAAAYQEAARLRQQAASGSAMNKTPH